jgi:ribosomal protein L13E
MRPDEVSVIVKYGRGFSSEIAALGLSGSTSKFPFATAP